MADPVMKGLTGGQKLSALARALRGSTGGDADASEAAKSAAAGLPAPEAPPQGMLETGKQPSLEDLYQVNNPELATKARTRKKAP